MIFRKMFGTSSKGNQMRAIGALATAGLLAAAATGTPARADDYPSRPGHIVVGCIPGSAADITARGAGNGRAARPGPPCVVENKPGAGPTPRGACCAPPPRGGE